jgi:hypothetical protein
MSSSAMNGVVFQISARMVIASALARSAGQDRHHWACSRTIPAFQCCSTPNAADLVGRRSPPLGA